MLARPVSQAAAGAQPRGFARRAAGTSVAEAVRDMRRSEATCLGPDQRGVLHVEYLVLVALVGIVVATAIVLIGLPMLGQYHHLQAVLTSPVV